MRRALTLLAISIGVLLAHHAEADTNVSGGISTSTTWTLAGSPYIVTGTISLGNASLPRPVLTIQPGVTVKFNAGTTLQIGFNYYGTTAEGELQAVGTASQPITFTANTATPSAGYWAGLQFYASGASSSLLKYATVSYAGVTGAYGGIRINASSPTIRNTTVQNCAHSGISLEAPSTSLIADTTLTSNPIGLYAAVGTSPSLQTVALTSNTGFAISVDPRVTFGTITGITATGNGTNATELRAWNASVDTSTTWKSFGIPYVATDNINVGNGSLPRPVLTIQPGVTVKFNAGKTMQIGFNYYGTTINGELQAVGTSALPIILTANTASPTAGYWVGLQFYGSGASASHLTYATVSYAGVTSVSGGIRINGSSPAITNTTAQNNLHSGISVEGVSTPQITSCTLTANVYGLWVYSPASPSLQTLALTNNTAYAIILDIKVTLGTVSGITASGNATNAVYLSSYNLVLDINATWKNLGIPYVVTSDVFLGGAGPPVLTIAPGVTLKFNADKTMLVGYNYYGTTINGTLQAVGTAAQPVIFTANTATPSAGFWRGLQFYYGASASQLTNATVAYGGMNGAFGGVRLTNASPTLNTVSLQNNAYAGINLEGTITPAILNCSFTGNTAGIVNNSPSNTVTARFSYWNSATGPSGSGPGTGQSVTAGVKFEPWLIAAPSQPQYFTTASHLNRTFNPAISVNTTIASTTTATGSWTITFTNTGGTVVRTVTGSSATPTVIWNGKNNSGTDQPDGSYTYELASIAAGGTATKARGTTIVDRTKQLTVTALAISQTFFSPNADTIQDTTTLSGTNPFDDTLWTINVKNSGGTTVRTGTSTALNLSFVWDGKNDSSVVQPDGAYTLQATASNGTASTLGSLGTTLDNTLPTTGIALPTSGQVLSNVYQSGSTNFNITGTVTDANFTNWTLDYGAGSNPSQWTRLNQGTTPITSALLNTWATDPVTNGLYTLSLQAWDRAGNKGILLRQTTVGNFRVTQAATQVNGATGGTVTYTSTIPFPLTQTLVLKNSQGITVRTLVNAARGAASFNDAWNARNDATILVPDGPYFYVSTVTDGVNTLVWDQTNQYVADTFMWGVTAGPTYDPFKNQPMSLTYNFSQTGLVSVAFATTGNSHIPSGCPPPDFCFIIDKYEESGPHTLYWAGTDSTGKYRPEAGGVTVVSRRTTFAKNAVVVYGTKPVITNVSVTPPFYGPAVGSQAVALDLSTYQNQAATVVITFRNHGSLSILRTVTLTNQAPGHITTAWDGRADNGMWVAEGFYTVSASATDGLGNTSSGQILTTVKY